MAFPGETLHKMEHRCESCGDEMTLDVQQSAAGFYLGFSCDCGPYSRETGYFATCEEASAVLVSGNIPWRQ